MGAAMLGVEVEQAKLDCSIQEDVDKYVAEHSSTLYGFVHTTGVLADQMISNLTWELCETCFNAKHRAALFIHGAFENNDMSNLNFFWLFSSVAVYGSMGQCNYGGSNAFLDAPSRHRTAIGKPTVTMQWGAWGEVGMAATMSAQHKARIAGGPMPYFTNKEGTQGLEQGLRSGVPLFSTYKIAGMMMAGAVQGGGSPGECYWRNTYSGMLALPPPAENSSTQDKYRYYGRALDYSQNKVFSTFVEPFTDGTVSLDM